MPAEAFFQGLLKTLPPSTVMAPNHRGQTALDLMPTTLRIAIKPQIYSVARVAEAWTMWTVGPGGFRGGGGEVKAHEVEWMGRDEREVAMASKVRKAVLRSGLKRVS